MEAMQPKRYERTTSEQGYPVLTLVREAHAEAEVAEFTELTRKQRSGLRLALAVVGGIGAATAAGYGVKQVFKTSGIGERTITQAEPGIDDDISVPNYTTAPTAPTESVVELPRQSEQFDRVVHRYEARLDTPYNSIRFVDVDGNSAGEPVRYQEFVDLYPEGRAPADNPNAQYRYVPSREFDEAVGFPTDGVSPEWVEYVQNHQLSNAGLVESSVNVNPEFTAIFQNPNYTELQDLIRAGEVTTYEDVLVYFAHQPFAGSEGLDRYEYAISQVSFRDEDLVIPVEGGETVRRAVPIETQEVLRSLLPGLIANESGFRDLTSDAGAQGPLQILPSEWERVTGETEVDVDYARQVSVWGEIISDFYDSTLDRIGEENLAVLRVQFATEEAFEREFASRIALGAYNAGPKRMAEVVRTYVQNTNPEDMPSGANLFQAVTEFGATATDEQYGGEYLDGYASDASSYVQKLEAAANALEERYRSGNQRFANLGN